MSLIQEALRRQQEDMDDNSGAPAAPETPAVPAPNPQEAPTIARKAPINMAPPDMDTSAPPPVQEPPTIEQEEPPPPPDDADDAGSDGETPPPPSGQSKEGKPGVKVAVIALGAILCLGLGVWAVTFAIQNFMTTPDVSAPADPTESGTIEPPAPAPEPVAPEPEPAPVDTAPVAQVEPVPQPVDVPVEPEPAVKEPIIWPILVIDGLVGKGAQGAVMINSQIIGVDESIEGVRIVSIDKQGCKLEFEGETKTVKVGGSTE